MENVLQSIVKIIIIGSLYKSTNVDGNQQFLPPPLPYYQNEGFFLPGFVPPHHEPLQIYYREPHAPPPLAYQNLNSYTPAQLFHRNQNYNPSLFSTAHNVRYSAPQTFQYKPNPQPPLAGQKNAFEVPPVNYKKLQAETSPKKTAFYATNIIIKDENQPPFYQDDYNKNYHDDDYTDNYSDESPPPPPNPCLGNSPYRYFESPKSNPTTPNVDKYTLCNPYFQPNFGNGVYTVKMPITLLPSRFPPRVEQLIERIQNYFSTYTQQETPKPLNETSPTTTVQPATEAATETEAVTIMTDNKKKNTTTEIEELSLEETNPETSVPSVSETETTAAAVAGSEQVTQKTIIVEIEAADEETTGGDATPEAHIEKKAIQQIPKEVTETVSSSTVASQQEVQTPEQTLPAIDSTTQVHYAQTQLGDVTSLKSTENQISNEVSHLGAPSTESNLIDEKGVTNAASEMLHKTEDSTVNETLLEVTDKNG